MALDQATEPPVGTAIRHATGAEVTPRTPVGGPSRKPRSEPNASDSAARQPEQPRRQLQDERSAEPKSRNAPEQQPQTKPTQLQLAIGPIQACHQWPQREYRGPQMGGFGGRHCK